MSGSVPGSSKRRALLCFLELLLQEKNRCRQFRKAWGKFSDAWFGFVVVAVGLGVYVAYRCRRRRPSHKLR